MRTELFIAIDLSIRTVERLVAQRDRIGAELPEGASARWVAPEHIRLPLVYLGRVEPDLVEMMREVLARMTRPLFPFQVECDAIGAHPSLERPRIVWAGISPEGAEVLSLLRRAIDKELAELGLGGDERPFHPRVMLGRMSSVEAIDLTEAVGSEQKVSFGVSTIKNIALFQVESHPDGPRYTVVERFALGDS